MSRARIANLTSLKTRNYVRGMIGQDDPASMMKALEKIRRTASKKDYQLVIEILRDSVLFKGREITGHFIKTCPKIITESIDNPPENIIDLFNENKNKLKNLLDRYELLLTEVSRGEFGTALRIADTLVDEAGVSSFMIRVLFFIRNHKPQKFEKNLSVDNLLRKIGIDRTSYFPRVIKELSNPRTDFFTICRKIDRIKERTPVGVISKSFVDHIPRTKEQFDERLSAFYAFSLVDAFLYLCCVHRMDVPFLRGMGSLDGELTEKFTAISKIDIKLHLIYDEYSDSADTEFFRDSFLLLEIESVFNYKTIHGALYNERERAEAERLPVERQIIKDYFSSVSKIEDIVKCKKRKIIGMHHYEPSSNSYLENSTALLNYIEKRSGCLEGEEDFFVKVMSLTKDIGIATSIYNLNNMAESAETEEYQLVVACLRSIKDDGIKAEHALRKSIQNVITSLHESNIISLLEYLYEISPSVTEHLVTLCDEMFLSKMFDIIEIPNEAIWTRAEMLEWYGEKTDDSSFSERAKNLRIDVSINKEKGTIDDSRIYVDPVKYTQWLSDNVVNNAVVLLDDIADSGKILSFSVNWESADSGLSAEEQLAALMLRSYREFCTNRYFGIASYLGRRIRHGTFKGTGMKEVREIKFQPKYESLFSYVDFRDHFDTWLQGYEGMLDQMAKERLHIRGAKKPEGIISYDLNSNNKIKIANYMLKEILDSYIRNENSLEIPYIATDYCWRLVEEDLSVFRKDLMSIKSKWAVFRYAGKNVQALRELGLNDFCQELNAVTADHFRTISSWFSKPSIASPSADLYLLFRAVVSEIKSYFPEFDPRINSEQGDLVITGGAYFVIYDALYIIIYNAAKYGDKSGRLSFDVHYDFADNGKLVTICITSDISRGDSMDAIKRSVEYAASLNFDDAHVVEGRSGIKKLKRMEYDKCIHNVGFNYGDSTLSVFFDFGVDY